MIDGLGRAMTRDEVARELGVGLDIIRANPAMFGGVKVSSGKTVFFEKLIVRNMEALNAAQAQESERNNRVVRQNHDRREAKGKAFPIQGGGGDVGGVIPATVPARPDSRHGLW